MTFEVVAIVRDEGQRIDAFLDAALDVCDLATIVDTGSSDDTLARLEARGFVDNSSAAHHGDTGQLAGRPPDLAYYRRPWRDFGSNRSEAFAIAGHEADWLLALDADMVVFVDGFAPADDVDAYLVDMGSPTGFSNRLPLVLRGDRDWISVGDVHEYTVLADGSLGRRAPTDAIRVSMPAAEPMTEAKLEWHAELLTQALIRDPHDARATFYLANTRRDQGRLGEADALYKQRATMGGWEEEVFYARWQAATFAPSWQQKADELMAAWESRPHRLEPLYDLVAGLNARGLHRSAYLLSDVALEATPDTLFVWGSVWDWGLPFERSIAAWWVGDRATFRRLTRTLLRRQLPAHIRTQVEANAALPAAA